MRLREERARGGVDGAQRVRSGDLGGRGVGTPVLRTVAPKKRGREKDEPGSGDWGLMREPGDCGSLDEDPVEDGRESLDYMELGRRGNSWHSLLIPGELRGGEATSSR